MNSQILTKINNFTKNRLLEFLGIALVLVSIFLLLSIVTYSPSDPNFIYTPENTEIKNIGGFYGSVVSDFLLQSIGLISILLVVNFFYWGLKIVVEKTISNFTTKIFYTLIYIIFGTTVLNSFYNDSFWLIDNGNGGFVGQAIRENIYYFSPFLENEYVIYSLILFTIIFLILSLSIKTKEIMKILLFPFIVIKQISNLFKRNKKNFDANTDSSNVHLEAENYEKNITKEKQPILPFSKKNKAISIDNNFKLPPINFLEKNPDLKNSKNTIDPKLTKNSEFLEKILLDFGVEGKIKRISCGPVVTLYEFEPASGIKVSKIVALADDIARNTSSISARVATIPGKSTIGIEIPNSKRENVFLNEIIADEKFNKRETKLPIALGKSISGASIVSDLYAMPHLLIAGTTGSGKSVGINAMIISLLFKFKPSECKLILIDPKMLELSIYENIPHLLSPVVTDPQKAVFALKWVVREMENRYRLMSSTNVKNIQSFNYKIKSTLIKGRKLYREVQTGIDSETKKPIIEKREIPLEKMPLIVVVVDEMADLMMIAGNPNRRKIQTHIRFPPTILTIKLLLSSRIEVCSYWWIQLVDTQGRSTDQFPSIGLKNLLDF